MPPESLVRMGLCVLGVTCQKGLAKGEVRCEGGQYATGDNRGLQPGDAVGVTPYPDTCNGQSMIECDVKCCWPLIVKPTQGGIARLLTSQTHWRVDKMANRVSYSRQLNAARIITSSSTTAGTAMSKAEATTRPDQHIIAALTATGPTDSRGVSVEALCASPGSSIHDSVLTGPAMSGLNETQANAVRAALKR